MANDARVQRMQAMKSAVNAWATKEKTELQAQAAILKVIKARGTAEKIATQTTVKTTSLSTKDLQAFIKT